MDGSGVRRFSELVTSGDDRKSKVVVDVSVHAG
jgi:hypothetical protein